MNEQENSVSFFRFEDLRIYDKAMDYIGWLYSTTSTFSEEKKDCVVDMFLKASHAIALHLAEGSSRNKAQFVYFLKMAKSSVRECVVYTEIACKAGMMNEDQREYSRNQLMELTKMIGSLIASLQRTTTTVKTAPSDDFDELTDDVM